MNAYYFDENAADDSWVAAAQRMGVDVLTPREAGMLV